MEPSHPEEPNKVDSPAELRYKSQIKEIQDTLSYIPVASVKKDGVAVSAITLTYPDDSESVGSPEYPTGVNLNFADKDIQAFPLSGYEKETLEEVRRRYMDTLDKILSSSKRQLDYDRKIQLIENLERQRGNIHRQAAEVIEQYLSIWEGVELTSEDTEKGPGKRLFEAYFLISQLNDTHSLFYTEDDLHGKDVDALSEGILRDLGIGVQIDKSVWGFHTGTPKAQYVITTSGASVSEKEKISDYIDSFSS